DIAKTGTNLDRPGFQDMLSDLNKKLFNIVIVKDLSRLSRNYLDAGDIIENVFKLNDIRFISLCDNFDTSSNNSDSMEYPIRNYLNSMYSTDLKKKVRKSVEIRAKKEKLIKIPKYGYNKINNKLVVDEYSANIVRSIYQYALNNYTLKQIENKLIEDNVLAPNFYKLTVLKININQNHKEVLSKPFAWNTVTIKNILTDYEYCGHTINIKNKNSINKEKNILIKNTHQSIINEEIFNKTPKVFKETKERETKYLNQFFICSKCNKSLALSERKNKDNNVYYCPKCLLKIKTLILEDYVYNDIKQLINNITNNNSVIDKHIYAKEKSNKQRLINNKNKLLNKAKDLFEDKISNKITNNEYKKQNENITNELNKIEDELLTLNFINIKSKEKSKKIIKFINNIDSLNYSKYEHIKELIYKVIVEVKDESVELNIKYKFIG
ncbi:MAG: recombinase family protein, partial [bacterium]